MVHVKMVVGGIGFILIMGCSSLHIKSPEELVGERALVRWNALIAGDLKNAYRYELPEYRAVYSLEQYKKRIYGVGTWKKAHIRKVECGIEKCIAKIQIDVRMKFGSGLGVTTSSSALEEQWIQSSSTDEWFHVLNQ